MTDSWYLIRTKPLSEYLAAASLERSGYESYLPRVQTPKPRAGHTDTPLFPGYLFVRQDDNGSTRPAIQQLTGVAGWVQFDGEVSTVPDEVITQLDSRIRAIDRSGGFWNRYRPGERVRVLLGSMESSAEVLEAAKTPQSRVRVLMGFMGQLVQTHVPWQDLRPLHSEGTSMVGGQERAPRRTRGKGRWIRGFGPRTVAGARTSNG